MKIVLVLAGLVLAEFLVDRLRSERDAQGDDPEAGSAR